MKTVTIWHTSDMHSTYGRFQQIEGYIARHAKKQDLILDAGDFCDYKAPLIEATDGKGGLLLLKKAGYDAMAVGNNEFLASAESLDGMSRQGVPMVSCNLLSVAKEPIGKVKPSILLEKEGVRFLIIGCSPTWIDKGGTTAYMDQAGVFTDLPLEHVKKELKKNKGKYDVAILLSHAGHDRDLIIAEQVQGLSVILSGHTHKIIAEEVHNGVLIQECGVYAKHLGKVVLTLDDEYHVKSMKGSLIEVDESMEADPSFVGYYKQLRHEADEILGVVDYVTEELDFDPFRECDAVNFICDAMYDNYDCDFALVNNGILSGPLGPEVTRGKLLDAAPSKLIPTAVFWKGKQIRQAIEASFDETHIHSDGKGAGFRGKVLGTLSFSSNVHIHKHSMKITIDDKPLDDERIYCVVTTDYLQRGSGYPMLGPSISDTVFHQGYIRTLLRDNLNDQAILKSCKERRILK